MQLTSILPDRPLEEQLAGMVRLSLGGRLYEVPTLTRRENRKWKAALEERLGAVVGGISATSNPALIMAALSGAGDLVVELVRLYDAEHIIPPDEDPALERDTDQEWLRALLSCAAAAYPFVGLALEAQRQAPSEPTPASPSGPAPTNSQRANGAGAHATSSVS